MLKLSGLVIRRRIPILVLALILSALGLYAMQAVTINYNMADYLPAEVPSSLALDFLGKGMPNVQVYVPNLAPEDAIPAKRKLASVPGVSAVLWLDDSMDMENIPFEMIPDVQKESFFAQGGALFQVTVEEDRLIEGVQGLENLYPNALFKGDAVNLVRLQTVSMGEVASIMYYVLPLVLIILFVSTSHWIEPLLFLLAIGVAILLNEGSNLMFGSVSFVTQACSAVLQLAVSIDYAVFLLHRFGEFRQEGLDAAAAMKQAMRASASAIAASAMTTVFGFLALTAMHFEMGADMGLVLAKGVLLSYLSVMIVLPAAATVSAKWVDATAHRSFWPESQRLGRMVVRYGAPIAIVALLILPPSFVGQQRNDFAYGSAAMHDGASPVRKQAEQINRLFGESQSMLLLVPAGSPADEAALAEDIKAIPQVHSLHSYSQTVGIEVPWEVLPQANLAMLEDRGYRRLFISAGIAPEGAESFALVETLRGAVRKYYGDDYYLAGENVVNYDLMQVITGDNLRVLFLGLLAIGAVLLLTFKNLTVPLILLLVIEGSIWINMSIPHFLGYQMNYIGYQIVSSVQLGATVDYGILLAQRYMDARRELGPKEAAALALSRSARSILPPMLILTIAGYALSLVVKSNGVISQMGEVLGRGAAVSGAMVLLVLPKLLQWADGLIIRTSLKKLDFTGEYTK